MKIQQMLCGLKSGHLAAGGLPVLRARLVDQSIAKRDRPTVKESLPMSNPPSRSFLPVILLVACAACSETSGTSSTAGGTKSGGGNPGSGGSVSAGGVVSSGGTVPTTGGSRSGRISSAGGGQATGGSVAAGTGTPGTVAPGGGSNSGGTAASAGSYSLNGEYMDYDHLAIPSALYHWNDPPTPIASRRI